MAKAVLVNGDRACLPRYLECHLHDILLSFPDPSGIIEDAPRPQKTRPVPPDHCDDRLSCQNMGTKICRHSFFFFFFFGFFFKQFDQYHHNKPRSPLAHREFRTLVIDKMDVRGQKELPGHFLPSPFLSALQFAVVSSTRPPGHRSQQT